MSPTPSLAHQRVVTRLGSMLDLYTVHHGGLALVAPVDVVLDEQNIVRPDVVYVSEARLPEIATPGALLGAPDLAVEVLSPETEQDDRGSKFELYARSGVRHYWLLDPGEGTLEAYLLSGAGYRKIAHMGVEEVFWPGLFPGLGIDLEQLMR